MLATCCIRRPELACENPHSVPCFLPIAETHAMCNELDAELIVEGEAKVMQNRTGSREEPAKPASGRAKQAAERKKRELDGKRGQEAPLGEASLSEKKDAIGTQERVRPMPPRARWQKLLGRRTA